MTLARTPSRIALVAAVAAAPGCVVQLGGPDYTPPEPVIEATAPATPGAIYQDSLDVRLFEDLRAGRVGDILTVRLSENTTATKSSSTETSKSGDVNIANPSIFGRNLQRNGDDLFSASIESEADFAGEGASSQSNRLDGDITVTVVKRLANGNLVIRGEKWVTLNQGDEFIRLSGIIRPADIAPDNSIQSSRVADARITYSSKGVLAAANRMGLLQRFAQSVWFPQ